MSPTIQSLGIDKLSREERIALVQEIWDSIAAESNQPLLTEKQRQELQRRIADDNVNPDDVVPWKQVEAWASTAKPGQSQETQASLDFKEWLAQQAEREESIQQRRQIISEWQGAVEDLFASVTRWLSEDDAGKVLTIEIGQVSLNEEGLGEYEISAMRIALSTKFVELVPLGRNIVGGIGKPGDLGLRVEGRVDMRKPAQKYMLYRVVKEEEKSWVIVDDDHYTVHDLTREAFEAALQDLLS